MSVDRIERVLHGVAVQRAEPNRLGFYQCHPAGSNESPVQFGTLEEVADFLRRIPRSGVRMRPGWSKISENIFIDGVPR